MRTATPARPVVGPSDPHPSEVERLRLVGRLVERLSVARAADELTVRAVELLTDDADPARADAMRPHVGDAAPLVERLSVWALRRADDRAVAGAHALLDRDVAA